MSGGGAVPRSAPAELPVDRTRIAVTEGAAQATRHVPLPAGDVGTPVDDAGRHDAAVPRVLERHAGPARKRPMGHADQPSCHRGPAGGALPVKPRAVPGDVAVEAPMRLPYDGRFHGRLGGLRPNPERLRYEVGFAKGHSFVQYARGAGVLI